MCFIYNPKCIKEGERKKKRSGRRGGEDKQTDRTVKWGRMEELTRTNKNNTPNIPLVTDTGSRGKYQRTIHQSQVGRRLSIKISR